MEREGAHQHTITIPVRWDELDTNGHVNNKVYQSYLDEARMQFMETLVSMQELAKEKIGPVITTISLKFKKELGYPNTVNVTSQLKADGKLRLQFLQSITNAQGELVCEADTEWLLLDLVKRRPVPFTNRLNLLPAKLDRLT